MAIKCVIFDVGGVLLKEATKSVYQALNKQLGQKIFLTDRLHDQAIVGKIKEKEYFGQLSKISGISPKKLNQLRTSAFLAMSSVDKETFEIARILRKKNYKTAVVSNMSEMGCKMNAQRGIFKPFSIRLLSSDAGCKKPSKKFCRILLDKIKLPPNNCVFIGDSKEDLTYFKKLGVKMIHFKNARQLKGGLRKLGVKI